MWCDVAAHPQKLATHLVNCIIKADLDSMADVYAAEDMSVEESSMKVEAFNPFATGSGPIPNRHSTSCREVRKSRRSPRRVKQQ